MFNLGGIYRRISWHRLAFQVLSIKTSTKRTVVLKVRYYVRVGNTYKPIPTPKPMLIINKKILDEFESVFLNSKPVQIEQLATA